MVIAIMAKYYNIPMISWAATSTDLANPKRFPTMARMIGSATRYAERRHVFWCFVLWPAFFRMGRAIKELLVYFNWKRIAMVYTDDGATRRCYSIAEGLRKTLPAAGILNAYNVAIDRATITDDEIDSILTVLPTKARSRGRQRVLGGKVGQIMLISVIMLCVEHEYDVRRFMLRAQQRGLTSKEFVYILPDYVRDGNRSELWVDYESNRNADGRNEEAKTAFRYAIFVSLVRVGSKPYIIELHSRSR